MPRELPNPSRALHTLAPAQPGACTRASREQGRQRVPFGERCGRRGGGALLRRGATGARGAASWSSSPGGAPGPAAALLRGAGLWPLRSTAPGAAARAWFVLFAQGFYFLCLSTLTRIVRELAESLESPPEPGCVVPLGFWPPCPPRLALPPGQCPCDGVPRASGTPRCLPPSPAAAFCAGAPLAAPWHLAGTANGALGPPRSVAQCRLPAVASAVPASRPPACPSPSRNEVTKLKFEGKTFYLYVSQKEVSALPSAARPERGRGRGFGGFSVPSAASPRSRSSSPCPRHSRLLQAASWRWLVTAVPLVTVMAVARYRRPTRYRHGGGSLPPSRSVSPGWGNQPQNLWLQLAPMHAISVTFFKDLFLEFKIF